MTQSEYEQKRWECWEEYCQTHPLCNTPVMRLNFDWTFDRAYALGKQEKDADTVISGWVARDADGTLWVFSQKPMRIGSNHWEGEAADFVLSQDTYPDLTWDDDPQEVETILKRKNK